MFVVGETLIALRRNLWLGLSAVTTVAISLYLFAGMFYVGRQLSTYVERDLPKQFEINVNLKKGVTIADIRRTAKYLRATPGVANVVWMPAQRKWDAYVKEHPEMADYGTETPYAEQLRVRLGDLAQSSAVEDKASRMSTVDKQGGVVSFHDTQVAVAQWTGFLRTVSYWLGGLLLAVSWVQILNAIRLTVESRRREIRIMRLVGASRIVVGLPFVLEGVLQGATGGGLALLGLLASHRLIATRLSALSVNASLAPFPTVPYLVALLAIGGGYGGVCALLAFRTPRRARFEV